MRAPILTALVTLVLTCPGQFCLAQTASSNAGSPQTLTGSGGSDRRGSDPAASGVLKNYPVAAPANAGQAARRGSTGRVGTLSPDEERRAARARARARAMAAEKAEAPAAAAHAGSVHAEDHAADLRRPAQPEAASVRPALPVAKAAAVPERAAVTASTSTDRPAHPHVAERKRLAYTSVARHPTSQARARLSDRLMAGDVARAPRIGDVVPSTARLSPVPPYYGPDRGLYEGRAVALERRPGFRMVFVAPRELPYPPQAGWYPPPPPPYGFPYPRYGF